MSEPCSCIETVNAKLADRNTQVHLPWFVIGGGTPRPFVETIKVDEGKRGKPTKLFASFCPFCGVKYPEREAAKVEEPAHG